MTTTIFDLFARSPIKPIQKHMQKSHECAEKLVPFFEATAAGDWEEARALYKKISRIERDADKIKKDIRLHMPKGLFLSVPRTDLLEIISTQDRIANKAEDISGLVLGRKAKIPEKIQHKFTEFLYRCIDASGQANKAINELDELVETGFRGHEVKLVEDMINKLDQIEHDTDKLQIELRDLLFALEKDLPPVDVMFLYKVIDWVGDLADHAEKVGGSLELLLAR